MEKGHKFKSDDEHGHRETALKPTRQWHGCGDGLLGSNTTCRRQQQ